MFRSTGGRAAWGSRASSPSIGARSGDAARFWTKAEGWCWVFVAVGHCASDVVGWHVPEKRDRWAALEPVRKGVLGHMGGLLQGRCPWYRSAARQAHPYGARQLQAQIKWLGIRSSPAYVGGPECNGVAERFIQHAQGGVHPSAGLRDLRGGPSGDRGLHRALQQRLASPAAMGTRPQPMTREKFSGRAA